MHRIHNKGRRPGKKRDYIKKPNRKVLPTYRTDYTAAAGQEKETQGLCKSVDGADAEKCMDFDVATSSSNLFVNKEVPKVGQKNLFSGDSKDAYSQRNEIAFDPPRPGKERFRLEGIQPVEMRQLSTPDEERNGSFLIATGPKGIAKSSNGEHHRGWWPCIVDSIHRLPIDIGDEQATSTDIWGLPLTISELHRRPEQERKQWQVSPSFLGSESSRSRELQEIHKGWRSSEKRGYVEDAKIYHPLYTYGIDYTSVTRHREATRALWEPFHYVAAKKHVEFDTAVYSRDLYEERGMPSHDKGQPYRSRDACFQSSETEFDPLKRFNEEIRAEGIQPAKRRQVFPQSGNRSGIFK